MTDRSRREILRSAGVLGVLGVGSGAGTYALLGDREAFLASSATGTLDLQLASSLDGTVPSDFEDTSDVVLSFPEFSPQETASGMATVALRSCTNPAWGFLRAADIGDSPLADHITAELTYRRDCDDAESESAVLYDGPLSGIENAVGDGLPLSAVDCTPLGKLEYDDETQTLTQEDNGDSVHIDDLPHTFQFDAGTLTVESVVWEDDKVIGVNVSTENLDLCAAHVKGGGQQGGNTGGDDDGVVHYRIGCARKATDLNAGTTGGGTQSGLSHVRFDICDGEPQCIECENPACVTLSWEYEPPQPKKTLESLANEDLELVLEFAARQCRHSTQEEP